MVDKFTKLLKGTVAWLNDQSWFQEGKGKWDELDSQSQVYLRYAITIGGLLTFAWITFDSLMSASEVRQNYHDKRDILRLLQRANSDINSRAAGASIGAGSNPTAALRRVSSGLKPQSVKITPGKKGETTKLSEESLVRVELNRVNIRQIVNYAASVETPGKPFKIRNLSISPVKGEDGAKGYLNGTLEVSAFVAKAKPKDDKKKKGK